MINIEVKKHNNLTIEFKNGIYISQNEKESSEFLINTWFYIPNSLNISPENYKKSDFYKDVQTYLRLITPIYSLDDILNAPDGPSMRLKEAFNPEKMSLGSDNLTYQIKMFMCILKSALRREMQVLALHPDIKDLDSFVEATIDKVKNIRDFYRKLKFSFKVKETDSEQFEFYKFGDEFLGNLIQQYCFLGLRILKKRQIVLNTQDLIVDLIEQEDIYKKDNAFLTISETDDRNNRLVLTQRNILKKLMESDLFLQIKKKNDGEFVKQFFYGLAAASAMLFATIISFVATQRYGNFTFDLLIVLVISYVFKDRIKEIMRYYFSNSLSKKYFDTKLKLNVRNQEIGEFKEAFNFTTTDKVPPEIAQLRMLSPMVEAETKIFGEQIFCYRKHVVLHKKKLEKYKEYKISGINDITRFEFTKYTQRMDDPNIPLFVTDSSDSGYKELKGTRVYAVYILFNCISETDHFNKGYRILLNVNGITDITELK